MNGALSKSRANAHVLNNYHNLCLIFVKWYLISSNEYEIMEKCALVLYLPIQWQELCQSELMSYLKEKFKCVFWIILEMISS